MSKEIKAIQAKITDRITIKYEGQDNRNTVVIASLRYRNRYFSTFGVATYNREDAEMVQRAAKFIKQVPTLTRKLLACNDLELLLMLPVAEMNARIAQVKLAFSSERGYQIAKGRAIKNLCRKIMEWEANNPAATEIFTPVEAPDTLEVALVA